MAVEKDAPSLGFGGGGRRNGEIVAAAAAVAAARASTLSLPREMGDRDCKYRDGRSREFFDISPDNFLKGSVKCYAIIRANLSIRYEKIREALNVS